MSGVLTNSNFLLVLVIFSDVEAIEFEADCPNNLFNCDISIPKQFGKQLLSLYYTGLTESICHYKASMIKADYHMYCSQGHFCGIILDKNFQGSEHIEIVDFDKLKMCQVYGSSKDNCK